MTPNQVEIKDRLMDAGIFQGRGLTGLVDGQYGSTGKGVISALLAELFHDRVHTVITNAGPNSGHTFYHGHEKVVLKQLPTFSVKARMMGVRNIKTVLSGGAIIDPKLLTDEISKFAVGHVTVHEAAAIISRNAKARDILTVRDIASTGQGVGPALIEKMLRDPLKPAIAGKFFSGFDESAPFYVDRWQFDPSETILMEVSQGFSLGLNSGFWPHVTSRECTIAQGMADAGIPPTFLSDCIMAVRTFPIRVGNVGDTSSGPCYPDQKEIEWDELGVEPELTTVTQRVRRVFTWSDQQFKDAVLANAPRVIFLNFVNYLKSGVRKFVEDRVIDPYREVTGGDPIVLLGHGPRSEHVELYEGGK